MINPLKSDLNPMVELLDSEDFDSAEDAAKAALVLAWTRYEERQSFAVMGQLLYTYDDQSKKLEPDNPLAIEICVGMYATKGTAEAAAKSLYHGTSSGEVYRYWVVPVFHGTPAAYHAERKLERGSDEKARKEAKVARIVATEQKRLNALQEAEDGLPDYLR